MEGAQIWLRWAQFIDLALVFGIPLIASLLGERRMSGQLRLVLGIGCLAGLGIGVLGFLVAMAVMAGSGIKDLDRDMVMMVACHTALGWSVLTRLGALLIGLILALSSRSLAPWPVVAGVAAASLVWGGHAAASQGAPGMARLAGDIAHLWCGLGWVGALLLFTARLWRASGEDSVILAQLTRALGGFALIGSVLVGVLLVSGLGNLLFLATPGAWGAIAHAPYGRLMIAKLSLFAGMFLLAARNRFLLVPALEQASLPLARQQALSALRLSVSLEMLLALGVILCVAAAGTLDPAAA
ncbi:CopD family protein [Novosphingobium terrae]|uniref:CopD family protein n=1 Tax=Novosphingobium terrae TaxID=2726189 RepID=UPI00197DB49C|nr:CopD family protein [Novosphingobium terrae]